MTLDEYLMSNGKRRRCVDVEVSIKDSRVQVFYWEPFDGIRKARIVQLSILDRVIYYKQIEEDPCLRTTDEDGNPKSRSVFKLID